MQAFHLPPTLAATLLAEIAYVVFGILLGIPAFRVARRHECWTAAIAAPVAFVVMMKVGGLVFALPVAIVVTGIYYLVFALRSRAEPGAAERG